jgi:hypothetical protein
MGVMSLKDPKRRDIESVLRDHGALKNFKSLEAAGCQRNHLLSLLWVSSQPFFADDSWGMLVGMELPTFKGFIERILRLATEIEDLGHRKAILAIYLANTKHPLFEMTQTLPGMLRQYVELLDSARKAIGPNKPLIRDIAQASLVSYVKTATGKAYDHELSSLIGAVLDKCGYGSDDLKTWRHEHQDLLKLANARPPEES